MVYTLFPDYQDIQSWRKRARILVFGCIKDRQTKDIQQQLKQQGWVPAIGRASFGGTATPRQQPCSGHLLHTHAV